MFTTPDELERRWTPARFVQLLDLDNDGIADEQATVELVDDINKLVEAMLYKKGFSHDQLVGLSKDGTLRRAAADLGKELAALNRTEMVRADGTTIYTPVGKMARDTINAIADGTLRVPAERSEGANQNMKSKRSPDPMPTFDITPTSANPKGKGGY